MFLIKWYKEWNFILLRENQAGQRLIRVLPKERTGHSKHHHQMVNMKIRLIILFAAKDGEAPYSQQKQDWELTVAQIMNSLLPNSDLIEESRENH